MRRPRGAVDAGMVTAETAAAIPCLVLVLALMLGCVRLGIDQVRCEDAARAGARAAARGDDPAAVTAAASRVAPEGAAIDVARVGGDVRVSVTARSPVRLPLVGPVPGPGARAIAADEGAP